MCAKENSSVMGFTLKEKIFAQFAYNGGVIVGAIGLYTVNPIIAVGFLLYAYVGITLLMRYTVCPRCPHLLVAGDCVQLPAAAVKVIISSSRKGQLNLMEKTLFFAVLYGNLVLPIYWLLSEPIYLAAFLIIYGGGSLLGLHLHFCRRCENIVCVQCRNKN